MIPFSDLARAAFCPRQCYYARREEDRSIPAGARERIDLAFRYPDLVDASDATLRRLPIRRSPATYRRNLDRLRRRPIYDRLVDPLRERAFVSGRDCHGLVWKVIEAPSEAAHDDGPSAATHDDGSFDGVGDDDAPADGTAAHVPQAPVIVSPGDPPERGVWKPQSVRAVAAAKALAWEQQRPVPRAYVEYPTVGVVREVTLTVRRKAAYRRALRTVRAIDGPPPRVDDDRCMSCTYQERCGVGRRSLRSLLG
ncbi:CRISPR-associated protein Cas4 [Halorubrum vacuolatum]|uniref:CRISPR-associated exonuclease Cas4 n=1 Tax=Halorubrum vacuolatum TaxID=63740 RepID=A0A238WAR6_HALVU|nr:hypothetical protein [Halorubrum vacuolatum]SNR43685.1 CRISPR-associated exonuclease Cas4 [Halorubrum vacuolatum]